jgi:hypothetical protein
MKLAERNSACAETAEFMNFIYAEEIHLQEPSIELSYGAKYSPEQMSIQRTEIYLLEMDRSVTGRRAQVLLLH